MNTIMQNDAAGPLRMLGTHTYTTDGKKAEEALQKSEARSRLAMEASNISLWKLDLITLEEYLSPSFFKILKINLPSTMKETTQLPLAGNEPLWL